MLELYNGHQEFITEKKTPDSDGTAQRRGVVFRDKSLLPWYKYYIFST